MATFLNGADLLNQSLELVESESIRNWATSEQNHPIWLKIAQEAVDKKGPSCDKSLFAAYIVSVAIGA